MMKKIFILFLSPLFAFAQSGKEFKLKGELKLSKPVDWVYLRYLSGNQNITDSVQSKNGEFKFEGKIFEPTLSTLVVKYAKQAEEEKNQREVAELFIEPTQMEFIAKDSLKAHTLTGSASQADFVELSKKAKEYNTKLAPLYKSYADAAKQQDKENMKKIEAQIDALDREMNDHVYLAFIKSHPKSPVALYALKQYAGYEIDAVKVEPLFNSLPSFERNYPSAIAFKKRIDVAKQTGIGNYAMDFTQNDTLGNAVSLSSFRGKYVLVDFWASWCGPCRRENPNVVKVFNKFKDKNFTILSVSLDRPGAKEKWLEAIHKDGLTWTHVSDLKFWNNAVAKQYGIQAIPQNFLLDPHGKIIAKNLRGDDLDARLTEILGKSDKVI